MKSKNLLNLFSQKQKRHYYADTLINQSLSVPARIKKNNTTVTLETLESHTRIENLKYRLSGKGYFQKKYCSASYTWSSRFIIQNDMLESPNYEFGCFSSKFLNAVEQETELDTLKSEITLELKYPPDLLYAIPQEIWDNFVDYLPDQAIANKLNLSKHRHLWPGYNYAVCADNLETKYLRADAFNKYHFLVSLLNIKKNTFDMYSFNPNGRFNDMWRNFIDTGVIAQGKTIEHIILTNEQRFLPYLTPIYLKKFSHCPSWLELDRLGRTLILPKSYEPAVQHHPIREDFDRVKLNEFIATLPSSKKDPEKFEKMIEDSHEILKHFKFATFDDSLIKSRIFYHERRHFGNLKKISVKEGFLQDYYAAIFTDLFFPEVVRQYFKLSEETLEEFHFNELTGYQFDHLIKDLLDTTKRLFVQFLTENLSIRQLISLQERWHRNMTVIESKKPLVPPTSIRKWHALFEPQCIGDVVFSCLTTEIDLKEEGLHMEHCVGGYATDCIMGNSHIISVKTPSGKRSTIQLDIPKNSEGNQVNIVQNRAERNKEPCHEIINATEIFLSRIRSHKIQLNPKRGGIGSSLPTYDTVTKIYPYYLDDQKSQELIYKAYNDSKVLPSMLTEKNYQGMMEKIGMELCLNLLNSYKSPESHSPQYIFHIGF